MKMNLNRNSKKVADSLKSQKLFFSKKLNRILIPYLWKGSRISDLFFSTKYTHAPSP